MKPRPSGSPDLAASLINLASRVVALRSQHPAQMRALADHIETYAADAGRQGWATQQGLLDRIGQGLHGRAMATAWQPLSEEEIRHLALAIHRVAATCAERALVTMRTPTTAPHGGDAA